MKRIVGDFTEITISQGVLFIEKYPLVLQKLASLPRKLMKFKIPCRDMAAENLGMLLLVCFC